MNVKGALKGGKLLELAMEHEFKPRISTPSAPGPSMCALSVKWWRPRQRADELFRQLGGQFL
jgi:hypothetical protein